MSGEWSTPSAHRLFPNYSLGMLYHQIARNDLAITFLHRAVLARPDFFDTSFNLGIIQREEGLLVDAQSTLESAIAMRPESSMAHLAFGQLLAERNRLDQ